jgi:hypothetical protein
MAVIASKASGDRDADHGSSITSAEFLFVRQPSKAVRGGLKQCGHEETPDYAIVAVVVVEEQPVVTILTGQRSIRRDGVGVDVHHVIACRVAPDLIGAQMMGVLRSTAFGFDPRRDRLAISPAVVRMRGAMKKGKPGRERYNAPDSPVSWSSFPVQRIHPELPGLAHSSGSPALRRPYSERK